MPRRRPSSLSPMTPVESAALRWWRGRCPLAWTDAEHVATPHVNCHTADERRLAESVAAMVVARQEARHGS